jgi:hypothetical protein
MSVSSAIGGRAFLDEYDLSDTTSHLPNMQFDVAQLNKTTIMHGAMARLDALRDGRLATVNHFDDATGKSHDALADFPASRADRLLTWCHRPLLGAAAISCWGQQETLTYDIQQNGDLLLNAAVAGSGFGVELGRLLTTGQQASTGTEALDGNDDGAGAATDWGAQFYLHVSAFTGTSVDIMIQDSDDDAATDPYVDIAAFTQVTGPTFERIQTSRTENIKEWLRVDLDGTYTALSLAVVAVPNRLGPVLF